LSDRHRATEEWFDIAAHSDNFSVIRSSLLSRWQQARMTVPRRHGDRIFFFFNPGIDDHYTLYGLRVSEQEKAVTLCRQVGQCSATPDGAVPLIEPERWPEGDRLEQVSVSPDGGYFLYRRYHATQGQASWFLGSTDKQGTNRPIELPDASRFRWHEDGSGLYVIDTDSDCHLRLIAIGTDDAGGAERCMVVTADGYPVALRHVTDEGALLLDWYNGSTDQLLLVAGGYNDNGHEPIVILDGDTEWFDFIGVHGEQFYFVNYRDSWHGEVISAGITNSTVHWQSEVGPTDVRLNHAVLTSLGLLLEYLEHAASSLYFQAFDSGVSEPVLLPAYGRIGETSVSDDGDDVYMRFDGLAQPPILLRFDPESAALQTVWEPSRVEAEKTLLVQRFFVDSGMKDERPVLVYVAGREDRMRAGPQALLLESYGGFGLPVDIGYSLSRAAWMDMGGLYALAGVRGGGEYDAAWYQQGTGVNRQRSIDDLLLIAEFLVAEGFTNADRLAVGGRSHGATLAASAAAQRPAQFAALVAVAGVMDLLRYPLDGAGASWLAEYGDPTDEQTARILRAVSPFHLVRDHPDLCHPATLVAAHENDPVVSAWHSYKYVAALQQRSEAPRVLLLDSVEQAHRETGGVDALVDDYSRRWLFLQDALITDSGTADCRAVR